MIDSAVTRLGVRPRTRPRRGWSVTTIVGAVCGAVVLFTITLGPFVIGQNPNAIDVLHTLAPASRAHWLGTDALGRDVAARIAYGGRVTLLIAAGATALATLIALPLGLATGYLGGTFDMVVTRIIDLFFAIPALLLAIGIVGILGPSIRSTILALGIGYWALYARLIRGSVVAVLARPYVDQSRAIGAGALRVLRLDILPALLPLLLVQTTVLLGFAVLDEAGLGFLGLGVQPPQASWGSILSDARQVILSNPGLSIVAGIPILLTVVALNLLSDALARRLDVRLAR
jgi:peptide/nickel transport system permease protein